MIASSQISDTANTNTEIGKKEQQLNVWIPKPLMKKLKVRGIEEDKSLKELVINALDQFL